MTISVRHSKVAVGADSGDSKVSSNAWNEAHTLTGTPNTLLGFDSLGAGVEVDPGTSIGVATRVALAAASSAIGSVYLREAGREGTFVWSSSDHSAHVTADTAQGLYVPPAATPSGASGAWVRKFSGPADFRWFGAVADCTVAGAGTSNTGAFDAARTALIAAGLGWLHIPQQAAAYRFATAPSTIHDGILITGEGWHENPGVVNGVTYVGVQTHPGTVLCFDSDIAGLSFAAATDNASNNIVLEFQSATGAVMRDIMLYSAGGTGTTAHGISNFTKLLLCNVRVEGFAGYGVYTAGDESGTAAQYGNPALSEYNGVSCRFNKLSGFFIEGNNCSVIRFIGCDAASNGGAGFLDKGPFGNLYACCHTTVNNVSYGTPTGYSAAQRTKNTTDWAGLSDSGAGSFVMVGAAAAHILSACYTESGLGSKAETSVATVTMGGNLSSSGSHTTSSVGPRYNGAQIVNINTVSADTSSVVDLKNTAAGGRVHVSNSGGNPTLRITGSGTAIFQMYPGGVASDGLDIATAAGAVYYSGDAHNWRNAAQTVAYAGLTSTGLDITATTPQLKISGTKVVGTRQTGTAANATDLATAITLVNDLKSKLVAHGLIS